MILVLYNAVLLLALLGGLPWWLWKIATTRKYGEGLLERLGRARDLADAAGRPLVWVHAVSVGEVLAVSRLVQMLDKALPGHCVAISTTTRTGQEVARERFGPDRVFYCPLDLPWAVRACLDSRQPAMLVLAETEFWPNLLAGCFRRGIPVVVVNARISDRSWPRYRRLRRWWAPILSRLTAVLAQSELDAERLRGVGCLPGRVRVCGNLKFDTLAIPGSRAAELIQERLAGQRLLVAGSTLEGEEALLAAAWPSLLAAEPRLVLVLAPRHPERFASVAALLDRSGFPWRRRSAFGDGNLAPGEFVLLDSMGELASVYSLASVALVGGSFVPAGGHNPLEPAQFGVPVIMGEHYANFRAIVERMRESGAIEIVRASGLAPALAALLRDQDSSRQLGERGKQVFERQSGATARSAATIQEILIAGFTGGRVE